MAHRCPDGFIVWLEPGEAKVHPTLARVSNCSPRPTVASLPVALPLEASWPVLAVPPGFAKLSMSYRLHPEFVRNVVLAEWPHLRMQSRPSEIKSSRT
jgi:hypothetical protein